MCSNLHLFGDQKGYKVAMEQLTKKYWHLPSLVNKWKDKLVASKGRTSQDGYLELRGCPQSQQGRADDEDRTGAQRHCGAST